jgi:hypothetical protein
MQIGGEDTRGNAMEKMKLGGRATDRQEDGREKAILVASDIDGAVCMNE